MRRLLILVASLAIVSGGVLQSDITVDLRPPVVQDTNYATGYDGAAGQTGLGASLVSVASIGNSASEGWVGIRPSQQQNQEIHYRGSALGTVPATAAAGQQYQQNNLATNANYQVQPSAAGGVNGNGHKYTTVTFGNGLVGLGHSVDYQAIGQLTAAGNTGYGAPAPPQQAQTQGQTNPNYAGGVGINTIGPAFGVGTSSPTSSSFSTATSQGHTQAQLVNVVGVVNTALNTNTESISHHTQAIPLEVPQPYPVTVSRPVHVPVAVPQPVEVPRPVPIEIFQPIPVPVERPYPVEVTRPVAVPVPVLKPVYVKVPQPVPVEKPYPLVITKPVPVKIPTKVEVPQYYPVKVDDHHHRHHFDNHNHHQHIDFHQQHHNFDHNHLHFDKHHNHHNQHHHYVNDHSNYHGSEHHRPSILAGLTGGLSDKLHGGHSGSLSHHYGNGFGSSSSFGSAHKFTNGLGLGLGHGDYNHHSSGFAAGSTLVGNDHKLGFSGNTLSLGAGASSYHGGYASGFSGKDIGGDYAKYASSYPSFGKSIYHEKYPAKYSDYSGKYTDFGASSSSHLHKEFPAIPPTISQQYDSNGGYKY